METKYTLCMTPLARADAMVIGDCYRFTILTDSLIRLEYQDEGRFVDEATQTVICRDFPAVEYRVIDKGTSLEIVTDKLHLYYDKMPFSTAGLTIELKGGFHVYGSAWRYGDQIEDLGGTARTLDGVDGAVDLESGLLSRGGFTVLDDSGAAFIQPDQWPAAKDRQSVDLYFFGYGHDYLRCLRDFYRLSGAAPLLPRFALGNWWSRFYRYSEESYLALMEEFQKRDIPLSVATVDMDWHLTDLPPKYGSGWTGYTWNPALFPNPKRFLEKLHEMGLHTTLNVHPADGVRAHEENYLPMAKELGVDYEHEDKIPFDASNRAFLEAYFQYLHHPNETLGVDFWWVDWQQGDRGGAAGIDTLWLLNHLHFLDSGRDGKQPLTFSRYAGLGSHRYPIGFSGDSFSTWASLDFQPYFTANASNAGYSWWSHDIGGHQGGRRDDELAVRWLQFGVFSPIMRLHSTSNEFYGKEPWNYNPIAKQIMSEFLRLRHKLIPYLYTMNYLTHEQGLPLMQPMYYRHEDEEAYEVPNQYYFGTQMIACPITKPVNQETLLAEFDAWVPDGNWFDLFTGRRYLGGRKLKLYRHLDTIPVLERAGGIVPLAGDTRDSHIRNPQELELYVYNGEAGSFDLYEDQGENAPGSPVITHFAFTPGKTAEFTISIDADENGVIPSGRSYRIHLFGIGQPSDITADGALLRYEYYPERCEAVIWLQGERMRRVCVYISLHSEGIVDVETLPEIFRILNLAQLPYDMKVKVYKACQETGEPARLLERLYEMELPASLMGAMMELITAKH